MSTYPLQCVGCREFPAFDGEWQRGKLYFARVRCSCGGAQGAGFTWSEAHQRCQAEWNNRVERERGQG